MPTNWETLQRLCVDLGFQEPEIRKKMWVTVVEIQDQHTVCHHRPEDAIEKAIQWCLGYQKENHG